MKIPNKKFSGYGSLLKESWQELWKRPVIFVPTAYSYIGFIILSLLVIGVAKLIYGSVKNVSDFTFGSVAAFVLLAVAAFFLFGAHAMSVTISFYRKIALGKQVHVKKTFLEASSLFGRVAKFLLCLVTLFIPIMIVVFIMLGFISFVAKGDAVGFIVFAVGFTTLMILVLSVIIGAWLTFRLPLLGYTTLKPWAVVKEMWHLLLFDAKFVWTTYLVYLGAWISIGIVLSVISAMLAGNAGQEPVAWSIINLMINILLGVWFNVYMFKAYVARYKPTM